MGNVIRVALPGFNCLSDTNLDHFALHSDQDNILIKEFARGSVVVPADNTLHNYVTHNLGYIPFFLAYVYSTDGTPNGWTLAPSFQGILSAPDYAVVADTQYLWFYNQIGTPQPFKYYIFYDNIIGGGTPTFTESAKVLKTSRQGVNALTTVNPNDFIFHSDLNTFKIVKEINFNFNYNGTPNSKYDIFYTNVFLRTAASFFVFLKFPDGYTTILTGIPGNKSDNGSYFASVLAFDERHITITVRGGGGAATIYGKLYIFETPLT